MRYGKGQAKLQERLEWPVLGLVPFDIGEWEAKPVDANGPEHGNTTARAHTERTRNEVTPQCV